MVRVIGISIVLQIVLVMVIVIVVVLVMVVGIAIGQRGAQGFFHPKGFCGSCVESAGNSKVPLGRSQNQASNGRKGYMRRTSFHKSLLYSYFHFLFQYPHITSYYI